MVTDCRNRKTSGTKEKKKGTRIEVRSVKATRLTSWQGKELKVCISPRGWLLSSGK
jgi:hypothetical protein